MAFALGRGVYAVTLEIARMRGAGLVIIDTSPAHLDPSLTTVSASYGRAGPAVATPAARLAGLAMSQRRRRSDVAAPSGLQDRSALLWLLRATWACAASPARSSRRGPVPRPSRG